MGRRLFLFSLFWLCGLNAAIGVAKAEDQRITAYLDQLTAQPAVPGAALIIQKGDDVSAYYSGTGDVDHPDRHINAESRFRLGSITKLYTAALIAQLVANNVFGYDDLVRLYTRPEFDATRVDNFNDVTFRHILDNLSGFADYLDGAFIQDTFLNNQCVDEESKALKYVENIPAIAKAGTQLGYSNTGYVILGDVLKAQFEQSDLEAIFKKHIFLPLGLEQTSFDGARNDVYGVERYSAALPYSSTDIWTGCLRLADGGLIATPEDVRQFVDVALRQKREGFVPYAGAISPQDTPYGRFWGHKGRFPGFVSAAFYQPEADIIIVMLVNSGLVNMDAAFDEVVKLVFNPDYRFEARDDLLWYSYQAEQSQKTNTALPLPISDVPPMTAE